MDTESQVFEAADDLIRDSSSYHRTAVRTNVYLETFIAGFFGGVSGLVVGHPFDTVKVRLQTQGTSALNSRYRGTLHCFTDIVKTERVWGLYKGIASPFLGISAMNSLRFGVYGNVLYYLERERTSRPAMKNVAVAGAVSGVAKLSLVVPIELVRIRMQLQGVGQKSQSMIPSRYSSGSTSRGRVYKSSFDCAVQLWRSGKLKAFYQGGVATAYRDVVGGAMYLLVWEKCSRVLAKGSDTHNLSVFQRLLAGGLTGVIGWTTVYPFDVVKTRMQLDGVSRKRVYSSTADCIKKSLKNEGYKFIFKGIAPTLLRAFPANAAFFTTYSFVMTYFHQQRQFVGN